jgi:hypothetical protein
MHPPQGSSEAAANPVVVGIPTAAIKFLLFDPKEQALT